MEQKWYIMDQMDQIQLIEPRNYQIIQLLLHLLVFIIYVQLSIDMPVRVSTLLDDIQDQEVTKLKFELQQAKDELNEINESAETKIKKVKAEGEFLGVLKEQKQRSSMKHLQMNYESELHQINRKLMITQNLHVAEIKKMKKSHVKHSLEIKLKDQKIKQLSGENSILITQKNDIKKLMQSDIEKLRNEFDEQMEKEINKRITQISQLKKETQAKLTAKGNENKRLVFMDEKDKLINALKNKIKQLEIIYNCIETGYDGIETGYDGMGTAYCCIEIRHGAIEIIFAD